jgi:hypothetical protein
MRLMRGEKMNRKLLVFAILLLLIVPMFTTALAQACSAEEKNHNKSERCTVSAYQTYNLKVTYDQLTDYCLNVWGLSTNPYPTYPAGVPTAYYIFTFRIGHDQYQGVSCNSYTGVYDPTTKVLTLTYDATWYVGNWGKANARMNQGFEGTVVVQCHNYNLITRAFDYYSAEFNLQGFQRFNHQTLILTVDDSRISTLATGICQVQCDRDRR